MNWFISGLLLVGSLYYVFYLPGRLLYSEVLSENNCECFTCHEPKKRAPPK